MRVMSACLAAAVFLGGCSGAGPEARLDAYLRAAAGAEADRGWSYLHHAIRKRYGNDQSRYVAEAAAQDWAAFQWTSPRLVFADDGTALVEVDVLSGPASVPAFLLEQRILHGHCRGSQAYGLGTYTGASFSSDTTISGGGLSGTQMRCDAQFIGHAAYERG